MRPSRRDRSAPSQNCTGVASSSCSHPGSIQWRPKRSPIIGSASGAESSAASATRRPSVSQDSKRSRRGGGTVGRLLVRRIACALHRGEQLGPSPGTRQPRDARLRSRGSLQRRARQAHAAEPSDARDAARAGHAPRSRDRPARARPCQPARSTAAAARPASSAPSDSTVARSVARLTLAARTPAPWRAPSRPARRSSRRSCNRRRRGGQGTAHRRPGVPAGGLDAQQLVVLGDAVAAARASRS